MASKTESRRSESLIEDRCQPNVDAQDWSCTMTELQYARYWRVIAILPRHAPDRHCQYWHRATGDGVVILVQMRADQRLEVLDDSPSSRFPAPANGLG
jgi:hypothetical protein